MGFLNKFFAARRYKDTTQPVSRSIVGISGGTNVNPESAMQVSAYYRGLMYISTQLAKLPIHVKTVNNEKVRNQVYKLLNKKPNSETNAFNFKTTLIQNAISFGNAYAEIERNLTGDAIALWFIPSQYVQPYRDPDGSLVYKIYNGRQNEVFIPKEDILHIRHLHSKDGIIGQGVASYGRDILGIALGADKFANAMYANSGIPSGVLEHPSKLSEEAYSRIRNSWKDQMGGRRTGGTAILEDGMKYNAVTLSPNVLQFLETRQFNVLEIARFLGVPPTKLYDPETQKFNSVEQSGLDVANDTLSVWAVNLEQEIDNKLLVGRFGSLESDFDMYALFKADMGTRATYFTKMMQVAAISPNEIRDLEGFEGYEGGERYFLATNNYSPMDRVDELIDKQVETNQGDNQTPDPAETNIDPIENKLNEAALKLLESKINK